MFCSVSPSVVALSLLALGSSVSLVPSSAEAEASAPLAQAVQGERQVLPLGLPAPRTGLQLPKGEPSLEDLVHRFEEAVGAVVLKTDHVCAQAASERVTLVSDLVLPPGEVYPFFENVLLQKGFHLAFLKGGAVPTFAVYSINQTPTSTMRWLPVGVEDLPALAEHPALLVSCTLDLDKADARQVANSLRMIAQNNTTIVCPSGERTLHLRGTGDFVGTVGLVALQSDAATPPPEPPPMPMPAGGQNVQRPAGAQGR